MKSKMVEAIPTGPGTHDATDKTFLARLFFLGWLFTWTGATFCVLRDPDAIFAGNSKWMGSAGPAQTRPTDVRRLARASTLVVRMSSARPFSWDDVPGGLAGYAAMPLT